MSCLSNAVASLMHDSMIGSATLIREEINITAECDCTQVETNVLCASDGVLYSSEPEPIFLDK